MPAPSPTSATSAKSTKSSSPSTAAASASSPASRWTSCLDGEIDLDDSTLAQMDIVVASVHSGFKQPVEEMTARVLRALENPYVRILGHPTGRKVIKREPYAIDLEQVLRRAAELGVAVEHNASPVARRSQ